MIVIVPSLTVRRAVKAPDDSKKNQYVPNVPAAQITQNRTKLTLTTSHAINCGLWNVKCRLFCAIAYFEGGECLRQIGPIHVHARYASPRRTQVEPFEKSIQGFARPCCRRLDRAIAQVAYPTGQLQPFGLFLRIVTEADALDAAMNDRMELCLLRHSRSISYRKAKPGDYSISGPSCMGRQDRVACLAIRLQSSPWNSRSSPTRLAELS